MKRRKMLAVLGCVGVTTIAGCSGDDNGGGSGDNNGDVSGDDTSDTTTTEGQFNVGTAIWRQRRGDAQGTGVVDVQGLTSENPSSYTVSLALEREVEYYPYYDPVFTENALIHRGAIRDKRTGETVRELPATETATPAIKDGRLYMVAGTDIIAVDIETNEELWRKTTGKDGVGIVVTSERVFVALGDGITALSASDGTREWNISITTIGRSGLTQGMFAVADGRLYVSAPTSRNTATVRDVSDGAELWSVRAGVSQLDRQGALYVGGFGGLNSPVKRFDNEGNQVWETRPSESGLIAAGDDHVYLGGWQTVATISPEDGSEQWATELPQPILSAAVGSDRVYAIGRGDTPRLFALDKQSGEQENIYALESDISPPMGAGGVTVGGGVVSVMSGSINENRMQVLTNN